MKTHLRALLLLVCVLHVKCFAQLPAENFIKVPANTIIRVRTTEGVASDTARVGDVVPMEVLSDVLINGRVVARQGAPAVGEISKVKEARSMGRRGHVALTLNYVEAITGEHLLVGGNRYEQGNGKAAKLTAEIALTTAATGGLIGALWLFEKGHDTSIPPGTAFSVYTVGDTTLDISLLAPHAVTAPNSGACGREFLADCSATRDVKCTDVLSRARSPCQNKTRYGRGDSGSDGRQPSREGWAEDRLHHLLSRRYSDQERTGIRGYDAESCSGQHHPPELAVQEQSRVDADVGHSSGIALTPYLTRPFAAAKNFNLRGRVWFPAGRVARPLISPVGVPSFAFSAEGGSRNCQRKFVDPCRS